MLSVLSGSIVALAMAAQTYSDSSPELERRDQAVDSVDVQILERALELISTEEKWAKHGSRRCKLEAETWTLFCALWKASQEVTGDYNHRRVALQEVRFAIEDVSNGKKFRHRMLDFNSDKGTSHEDVTAVIQLALGRVAERAQPETYSAQQN